MTIAARASGLLSVTMMVAAVGESTQQVLLQLSDDPNPIVLECRADYEPDVYVSFSPPKLHISSRGGDVQATVLSVSRVDASVREISSSTAELDATIVRTEASPVRMAGGRWQT